MKTKICTKCKKEKHLSDFHKHKNRLDGYNGWCKECKKTKCSWTHPKRQKRYYDSKGYKTNLNRLYGEGAGDWYERKLQEQQECCAICGIPQKQLPHRLSLDHCHRTGKWRGVLCKMCNYAISSFDADNPENCIELLQKAIKYIKENK